MARFGLKSYRFSVAWGRILPSGRGKVNRRGLDFYERMVDLLLERDIRPMVTLYHWDLPAALDDEGGWLNPDIADWFTDYAQVLFHALDDRVQLWTTLNEPWVVSNHGYRIGEMAPGRRSLRETAIVGHHLLRAHASAATLYAESGRHSLGIVVNLEPKHPTSDSDADRAAAEREHVYQNAYYLDPLFFGRYPEGAAALFGAAWPGFDDEEVATLMRVPDFVGVNYYTRAVVRAGREDAFLRSERSRPADAEYTSMGWEIYPSGLTESLRWVTARYGKIPLFVTENGAAFVDPDPADGLVRDPRRRAYLQRHIEAARDALASGVDLRGYYAWSLLDNFEWAHGYSQRFGIVFVDYRTLERTPKESALYYRDVVASNGRSAATFS